MINEEIIYFIFWMIGSFTIAFYLQKKFLFFQKLVGVFTLFVGFLFLVLLHNGVYAIFRIEEPIFFLLSLFSLGVSIFLIVILAIKRKIKL